MILNTSIYKFFIHILRCGGVLDFFFFKSINHKKMTAIFVLPKVSFIDIYFFVFVLA